jgi:hypothetical protein
MFRNEHPKTIPYIGIFAFEALHYPHIQDAQPFPHLLCHLSEQTHLDRLSMI